MMQRVVRVVTLSAALALARPAHAHVSPSVNDNNRYLKVTPGTDRIRIAYTVFYGEVPGRLLRTEMDADKDGHLSAAEAKVTGDKVAADLAASLELTVDGTRPPVIWASRSVGLGTPEVAGGAFSVDLVASICLPTARDHHDVLLRDRFRVANPGETEVKIEDGLGITIDRSRIGAAQDSAHDYKFLGPGGPLLDDGLALQFTVGPTAPRAGARGDPTCRAAPVQREHLPSVVLAGAVIGALVAAYAARRRRRA